MAQTVLGEAEGEDRRGKLAVAWVIRNRADQNGWPDNMKSVALQHMQFSCWNDGHPGRKRMDSPKTYVSEDIWHDCFLAAISAMYDIAPDPTHGANHYLNVELTRKINKGRLPSWFDQAAVTAEIGEHTFLRL